ncbi:hypothetical protein Ancab_037967 [Ancistrocladus abbreviatus]
MLGRGMTITDMDMSVHVSFFRNRVSCYTFWPNVYVSSPKEQNMLQKITAIGKLQKSKITSILNDWRLLDGFHEGISLKSMELEGENGYSSVYGFSSPSLVSYFPGMIFSFSV